MFLIQYTLFRLYLYIVVDFFNFPVGLSNTCKYGGTFVGKNCLFDLSQRSLIMVAPLSISDREFRWLESFKMKSMKMARSGPLLAPPPLPGCIRIVRGKWSMTNGEPSPVHIFRLISTVPCTTHSTECVTRSRRFSRTSSVAGVRRFMFRSPSYVRSVLNPIRLSRRRNDVIIIYKRSSRSRVSRDFRLIVYRRRVRHNNS